MLNSARNILPARSQYKVLAHSYHTGAITHIGIYTGRANSARNACTAANGHAIL